MRVTGILVAAAVAFGTASMTLAADPVNVSGSWTVTLTAPRGERTSAMVFTQDGATLTVTSKTERGERTGSGTVTGDAVEWSFTREGPRGTVSWTYKGTIAGDTMSGTVEIRGKTLAWKAERAK